MKRSTRSFTCNVDMPASSCPSSISKTDASSLPDICMSASSSGVFSTSRGRKLGEARTRRRELHFHDVVERQVRIGLGQHADLHPIFGLRIDRPAHQFAHAANIFMQLVVDLHDSHWCFP